MAGPKTTPALAALAALRPTSSAPTSSASSRSSRKSTATPAAAGVAAGAEGDYQRLTIRIPDDEAELLKKARLFLVGKERKSIDGRIVLTALRLAKLDEAFLAEYDAFDERDGRSRTSLGKL